MIDTNDVITEEQRFKLPDIINGHAAADVADLAEIRRKSLPILGAIAREMTSALSVRNEVGEKSDAAAIEKCSRQATLIRYPWFRLCHLRDYLRFRTYLEAPYDFQRVWDFFVAKEREGIVSIVKIDVGKLVEPGAFGWRMIATDIRIAETGMIVEHYMTFSDLIHVNEQWLHALYEKWRSVDFDDLPLSALDDRDRDHRFSRHAYRELMIDHFLREPRADLMLRMRRGMSAIQLREAIQGLFA